MWRVVGIIAGAILVYFLVSAVVAMTGPRHYEGVIGGVLALVFTVAMFTRKKTA
jgi:hypothetical protein